MRRISGSLLFSRGALLLATAGLSLACSSGANENDGCTPDDADGIISEPASVFLTVTDTKFEPIVVATQNTSEITLKLTNEGTRPHSFVVACKPTPNNDGCPMESCFPSESKIEPVAPGQEVTIIFETPLVEGIYDFHSDVAEDTELTPGQFIIQ
jgi:hypothetical protein